MEYIKEKGKFRFSGIEKYLSESIKSSNLENMSLASKVFHNHMVIFRDHYHRRDDKFIEETILNICDQLPSLKKKSNI